MCNSDRISSRKAGIHFCAVAAGRKWPESEWRGISYKLSRTETGDPILANIESDDEYAKAAEAFDVVLDNARKAEAAGEPLE